MPLLFNKPTKTMGPSPIDLHSASAQADASLPTYSLPSLDPLLNDITRITQTLLDSKTHSHFTTSLATLNPTLQPAFNALTQHLSTSTNPNTNNWATTSFKTLLLSLRTPPAETSLTFTLPNPGGGRRLSQATTTAALLRAIAELYTAPATLDIIRSDGSAKRFETRQLAELFATTRRPGTEQDALVTFPRARHVVLWRRGRAFCLDVLDATMRPVDAGVLAGQVQGVLDAAETEPGALSVAGMSTMLDRTRWAEEYARLREHSPEAVERMESSLVSVALHEEVVGDDVQERLRVIRADGRDVYSDATMGFSVFADGAVGGRVDHAVADGGVIVRLLGMVQGAMVRLLEEGGVGAVMDAHYAAVVEEVDFRSFRGMSVQAPSPSESLAKERRTMDIPQPPDVLDLLRSSRLLNVTTQLAFQAALFSIGESGGLVVEPVSVRSFKDGRCDPNYVVTPESLALLKAAAAGEPEGKLLQAFLASVDTYNQHVRRIRDGAAVGPGIMLLRSALETLPESEARSTALGVLTRFQRPAAYFTGAVAVDHVEAVEANVFAPDQVALTYMGKQDRLTVCVTGTGRFVRKTDLLLRRFGENLQRLGALATAVAGVEQMYPTRGLEVLAGFAVSMAKEASGEEKNVGTVAIHAGAGEEFGLERHETKLVEFLLEVVTREAQAQLAAGSPAVTVAEEAVAALENCVFFNAGKGAVYTAAGDHELEACIVDGATGAAGAVACCRAVRNPIRAARAVMAATPHSLLAGPAADDFAASVALPLVPNRHFDSHARRLQYCRSALSSADISAHSSAHSSVQHPQHPQTVGAVVLDRCGRLAVATSTGGVVNKLPGRVGDTAIVGAGCFADSRIAVACSGQGDAFLRESIASRIALGAHDDMQSILETLQQKTGAAGAVLTVDAAGKVRLAQTSGSFFVAASEPGQRVWSKVIVKDRVPTDATPFFTDENVDAFVSSRPTTSGDTVVRVKAGSLTKLSKHQFAQVLLSIKQVAIIVKAATETQRVALVATANDQVFLIPLHGVSAEWKPALDADEEYHTSYPSYISSKNGPKSDNDTLTKIQAQITGGQAPAMDSTCLAEGDVRDNLFAKIIRGELEQWRVWESRSHVAFLTPFGNTPGYTVLVPRKHLDSDILALDDCDLYDLASAIWDASKLIEQSTLGASRVGLIFEGMEINWAHAKLIPILGSGDGVPPMEAAFSDQYGGSVSSKPGPMADPADLEELRIKLTSASNTLRTIVPTKTWREPSTHYLQALKSPWYRGIFQILNTLFHATTDYFHNELGYKYALTPLTTDCISSPMGLGSDSQPVQIDLFGQPTYLADSMQFTLEYLLRFDANTTTPGLYYISPSFRGEDHDATHLNQFFHVECELHGTMDDAIRTAEAYIIALTRAMLAQHGPLIQRIAGSTAHLTTLLSTYQPATGFPRIPLDTAIASLPSPSSWEYVVPGSPGHGRKLTRHGEQALLAQHGGTPIWLTEMDHLSVPFYQAYVPGTEGAKAKAADLLLGLGETLGMGERHGTPAEAAAALAQHGVPRERYEWYLGIREAQALRTSGWGMGSERFLCWLLGQGDVRDLALVPRLKGERFLP